MPTTRIYIRASTEKQALSPERQATLCSDYHAVMGILPPLFPQVYQDPATSGSVPFDNRPAGHQLLLDCGRLDHVIVDAYDRIGRDVPDMLNVVRIFTKRGVIVHMLNMLILSKLDPDDPMSEFMLTQLASVSQMERKITSVRTKRGIQARQMQGYSAGFAVPIGMKKVPNPEFDYDKAKASSHYRVPRYLLVPNPDEQRWFDEAWRLYVAGMGVPQIHAKLSDWKGSEGWSANRLWRRLTQKKKRLQDEQFRQERKRVFDT